MQYIRRIFLITAIFFVGFGTSRLLSATYQSPVSTSIEISKEATTTASLFSTASGELIRVTRVIDGDTIEIEGGKRVRYIGMDTPETINSQKPIECFGREASAQNKALVEGTAVRLEKDISETDRYGRLLRYVYLPAQAGVGDTFVNDYLVRQGFAHVSTFPPDVKYSQHFLEAEREAREEHRGLWGGCASEENPTNNTNTPINTNAPISTNKNETNAQCTIKGNISTSGEKIYHVSGCGSYDKTVIDEGTGEKWFCSEQEAVAASWRKAKNCP